ncbi:MAG: transporter substrate-binding domain-containing protein [Rhodomicrobiaceae bacterium]
MGFSTPGKIARLAVAVLFGLQGSAVAGTLDEIKARGELVVGVKADDPPFGYRDRSGAIIGMETDLAKDLANRLGVKFEPFAVDATSRLQFLQQGKIDLIIATMAVTDERRRQAGIIEPFYYASRVAALAPKSLAIKAIKDLDGKPVCIIREAYFENELRSRAPSLKLVEVRSLSDGAAAIRSGRCAAFVEENVRLIYFKQSGGSAWADDAVTALDFPPLPWAIAVRSVDRDAALGRFVSQAVTDWHRTGKLLALEKQWLGENTDWLAEMHDKLK